MSRIVTSLGLLAVVALPVAAAAQTPTFTKDIAPIFQNKCEACHRPDSIAPMSLVSFEESRPWARSIKNRVASRQMPPWHIDKTVGVTEFENDRSLSDKEIETIVKWVDAGSPKGDPKDMPAAKVWPNEQGWNYAKQFGQKEPDLVDQVAAVDAEGRRQRRVVEARRRNAPHRAALGARP